MFAVERKQKMKMNLAGAPEDLELNFAALRVESSQCLTFGYFPDLVFEL